MIHIENLTETDRGRPVQYQSLDGTMIENGVIKSWNDTLVFVVFHCNNDWGRYQNYTAQGCLPDYLTFTTEE